MKLKDNRTGKKAKFLSDVSLSLHGNYLIFAFNSRNTTFNSYSSKNNADLFRGDVVEVFLSIGKPNHYYEIEVAPNNTLFLGEIFNDEVTRKLHRLRKNTFVETKTTHYNNGYKTTIKINLLTIDANIKNIKFNCFRIETEGLKRDKNLFSLSPTMSGSFHKPEYFLTLTDFIPTHNTSINTGFLNNLKDSKEVVKTLKEVGFDCYDFSFDVCWDESLDTFINHDDYLKRAKALRKYADKIGIKCNQAHAPFRVIPKEGTAKQRKLQWTRVIRSFECASILGARGIVVHPINEWPIEDNVKLINKLVPYAKKFNIILYIENMWCWDEKNRHALPAACSHPKYFAGLLEALDSGYVKALLDIGHAEMFYPELNASMLIHSLGDNLYGLHIHDNDQIYDMHRIPGECKINFQNMLDALKAINYQGDLTLEVMDWSKVYSDNKLENLKLAYRVINEMKNSFYR